MDSTGTSATGWRRLRRWQWLALALGAVGVVVAVLVVTRTDGVGATPGVKACKAVVREVRRTGTSEAAILGVVRRQGPVARAQAERDPAFRPVADAMEQMRLDLEARRPWPSVVTLYSACG